MTEPTVRIDTMTATLLLDHHAAADATRTRRRFDRAIDRMHGGGLADAFSRVDLGVGHWCIRRLDVPLVLAPDVGETTLGDRWADDLAAAVVTTIRDGSTDVVHYRSDAHVMLDVVVSAARGDRTRAWAWAQVIPTSDAASTDLRRTALTALAWRPHLALPTLVATLDRVDLTVVADLLGPDGWAEVTSLARADTAPTSARTTQVDERPAPDSLRRTDAIIGSSSIARRILRSDVQLDESTRGALAALVVAEAQPAALASVEFPDLAAAVHARLQQGRAVRRPASTAPAAPAAAPAHPDGADRDDVRPTTPEGTVRPPVGPNTAHPSVDTSPASRAARPRNEIAPTPPPETRPTPVVDPLTPTAVDVTSRRTSAAGLLFLLNTADDAGLPSVALDEPALADRPLGWVLIATAARLAGISRCDPACEALAGLTEEHADLVADLPPAGKAARRAVDDLACRWATATARRVALAAGTDPVPPVEDVEAVPALLETIVRRPGRITASPGWIDVGLELADVDVGLRRAGLDLDPGWIPWLGVVVRFRYG